MDMPVIMFDKNEDYVVLTLEQVSSAARPVACPVANPRAPQLLPLSFGPDHLPPPGAPGAS